LDEGSGVARFLHKRGPGLHHLCLEVDDIEAALARLSEQGAALINPEPLTAPDGVRVAFIHPRSASGVLIELYELPA
jgi:methylmalonyl-CoA/ethylmalonyl-CoA epimerase